MQSTSLNQSDGRWVSVSSSVLTSLAALASFSSSGVRGCWRLCCRFSTILSQHHADCAFQFLDCATFFRRLRIPLCWRSPISDKRHLPVSFEHLLPGCQAFPASLQDFLCPRDSAWIASFPATRITSRGITGTVCAISAMPVSSRLGLSVAGVPSRGF